MPLFFFPAFHFAVLFPKIVTGEQSPAMADKLSRGKLSSVILKAQKSKGEKKNTQPQAISESEHYTRDWGVGELSRACTPVRFHRAKWHSRASTPLVSITHMRVQWVVLVVKGQHSSGGYTGC